MLEVEDILTLPNEGPLELAPESGAPAVELSQFAAAVFSDDDVLSLADELPLLQPLPLVQKLPEQAQLPLRCTEPLGQFSGLIGGAAFADLSFAPTGERTDWSKSTSGEPFVPASPEPAESASLAAEFAARLAAVEFPAEPLVQAEKHVVFALAGAKYAVPMEQVLEVCDFDQLTPVINVPEWVIGITNLRGDIVSVIDLCHFLATSADARAPRKLLRNLVVVQTQAADLTTCLAVEKMLGLAQVPTAEIQKVERVFGDGLTPHTRGIFAQGDELLSMLNLESLLRALEISG